MRDHADLLDFQPARDVRQPGEIFRSDARGGSDADHREHHVARSGDVINFAFSRGEHFARPSFLVKAMPSLSSVTNAYSNSNWAHKIRPAAKASLGVVDFPPRGPAGFQAVGGDGGRSHVRPAIARTRRIDDHRHAAFLGAGDDFLRHLAGANAFGVIGNQHRLIIVEARKHGTQHVFRQVAGNRRADFAIDAEHLMRMPMLCPAEIALFHRGRAVGIADDAGAIDALAFEFQPDQSAFEVCPDDAGHRHVRIESAEQIGDVRRPAEPDFLPVFAEQNHGGFLADAFGIAPHVAVEDQIPDHQNPGPAQVLNNVNQVVRHCGRSLFFFEATKAAEATKGQRRKKAKSGGFCVRPLPLGGEPPV